jgi:transposase
MIGPRKVRQLGFLDETALAPPTRLRRLLQRLGERVDFGFVRPLAAPHFAAGGRPSLDPVVVVKMLLLGYLFGISSDRRLVEDCADRLSFREFLGYGSGEALPDHSALTYWRQRLGPEFFRQMLHEVAAQCARAGMPLSQARTVDGTRVKAQADTAGPVREVPAAGTVHDFVAEYFAGDPPAALPPAAVEPPAAETVKINDHDPDARLHARPGAAAEFSYFVSFSADAATGIICDATASAREEALTAAEHVDRDPLGVRELCADRLYDHGVLLRELQARGVRAYVPARRTARPGYFSKDVFRYDGVADCYYCPAGQALRLARLTWPEGKRYYLGRVAACGRCALKARCTSARARTITRRATEAARQQAVRAGPRYRYLQARRRQHEHLHALGKRDHGLRRARSLGLAGMQTQACLTATAINLLKLARWTPPAAAAAAWGVVGALTGAVRALHSALRRRGGRRRPIAPRQPRPARPAYAH